MKKVAPGVYTKNGRFYGRFYIDGKDTYRRLYSIRKPEAIQERKQRTADIKLAARGLIKDAPDAACQTIGQIVDFYLDANCPKIGATEEKREGRLLRDEKARCMKLKSFFDRKPIALDVIVLRRYKEFRLGCGSGTRSVDMEISSLSAAWQYAMLYQDQTGIDSNPLPGCRIRFHLYKQAKHARAFQPEDAKELHKIAAWFFTDSTESHPLGWQVLMQAMTGLRAHEIVQLRWDAKNEYQAGYVDAGKLFLPRSDTHKGTYPYLEISEPLEDAIEALKCWNEKFIQSDWWFPSFRRLGEPLRADALPRRMPACCKALGLPKRTSHGMRSYFVNVLRSQGMADWEIALRIGHKTGGRLIVDVYGEFSPIKIGWETDNPAWSVFEFFGEKKVVAGPFTRNATP